MWWPSIRALAGTIGARHRSRVRGTFNEVAYGSNLVTMPEILQRALDRSPAAKAAWDRVPPSTRREHVGAIAEAKREETRKRRVERAIEQTVAWAEKRSSR